MERNKKNIFFHSRLIVSSLIPGYFYLKFGHFSRQCHCTLLVDRFFFDSQLLKWCSENTCWPSKQGCHMSFLFMKRTSVTTLLRQPLLVGLVTVTTPWVTTTTPLNTAADQFQSEGNCWGNIRKLRSLCMMWVWLTARNRTTKRE